MSKIKYVYCTDSIYFELTNNPHSWNLKYHRLNKNFSLMNFSDGSTDVMNLQDFRLISDEELFQLSVQVEYNVYLIKSIQEYCYCNSFYSGLDGTIEV